MSSQKFKKWSKLLLQGVICNQKEENLTKELHRWFLVKRYNLIFARVNCEPKIHRETNEKILKIPSKKLNFVTTSRKIHKIRSIFDEIRILLLWWKIKKNGRNRAGLGKVETSMMIPLKIIWVKTRGPILWIIPTKILRSTKRSFKVPFNNPNLI